MPVLRLDLDDTQREQRELRATRTRRTEAAAVPAAATPTPVTTGAHKRTPRVHARRPTTDTAHRAAPRRAQPAAPAVGLPAAGRAAAVVAFARAQVGKRYVFATAGPNTFDCSGLVVAAYRLVGLGLPHQTGALAGRGRPVSRAQLAPGDLVFPASGHVGIYVGGGMMVHASTPRGGVKLSPVYAFSFARRVL